MKPGSFTQIYIQIVFSPEHRDALLIDKIRTRVFKYMHGIIESLGHKSIIINGCADHVHIFIGINPAISISDTVKEIKRVSSIFINNLNVFQGKFKWQEGYGAFSYSKSQMSNVYNYILNQEQHHKKKTFREEYLSLLEKFEIEYDEKYLFRFFE
ncbi:MAG: IS200/IS605 family transposase [Prolixibacteraceae bacterium]|nr:IS200/IS605 family transposase [Prolixibacteraceae bacterium]